MPRVVQTRHAVASNASDAEGRVAPRFQRYTSKQSDVPHVSGERRVLVKRARRVVTLPKRETCPPQTETCPRCQACQERAPTPKRDVSQLSGVSGERPDSFPKKGTCPRCQACQEQGSTLSPQKEMRPRCQACQAKRDFIQGGTCPRCQACQAKRDFIQGETCPRCHACQERGHTQKETCPRCQAFRREVDPELLC